MPRVSGVRIFYQNIGLITRNLQFIPAIHINAALAIIVALTAISHILAIPYPVLLTQWYWQRFQRRIEDDFWRGVVKPIQLVA